MWIPSLLAIVGSTLCVAVAAMGGCGGKGVLSCETEIPACLVSHFALTPGNPLLFSVK